MLLQDNIVCEEVNREGVIGYVSEQNYTESMPEASHEEGKKKHIMQMDLAEMEMMLIMG